MPVSRTVKCRPSGDRLAFEPRCDLAASGELDRVVDEVEQDLTDAHGVAHDEGRYVGGDVASELEAFLVRAKRQRA